MYRNLCTILKIGSIIWYIFILIKTANIRFSTNKVKLRVFSIVKSNITFFDFVRGAVVVS